MTVDGHTQTGIASPPDLTFCALPLVNAPLANGILFDGCDANTTSCWSYSQDWSLPSWLQRLQEHHRAVDLAYWQGIFFYLAEWQEVHHLRGEHSMTPLAGQLYLQAGQKAPIYLYRDPSGK